MHTHIHTNTHSYKYIHENIYIQTYIHINMHVYTQTHIQPHAYAHTLNKYQLEPTACQPLLGVYRHTHRQDRWNLCSCRVIFKRVELEIIKLMNEQDTLI